MAVVEDVPGAVKAACSPGSGRRAAEVDQAVDLVAAYCFGEVVAGVGGVAVEAGVLVGTGLGAVVVGPTGGVDDACDPPGVDPFELRLRVGTIVVDRLQVLDLTGLAVRAGSGAKRPT